ncbi:MAG: TraU family protein [bacterium]
MRKILIISLFILAVLSFSLKAYAGVCKIGDTIFTEPPAGIFTAVDWAGIFPIRIGGAVVAPGIPDKQDYLPPACFCQRLPPPAPPIPGITFSMWQPAHLTEVVEQPYCFPSLGFQIPNPTGVYGNGSGPSKGHGLTFYQSHYYNFPLLNILGIAQDLICLQSPFGSNINLPFISEPDPMWQSDILATFGSPEAILFANPIAQTSCIADSVAAQVYQPLDPMFWCMGSWGGVFPVSGDTRGGKDMVQGAAAIAAKTQFLMHEYLNQFGTVGPPTYMGVCQDYPDPVWIKSAVRYDMSMPVPEPVVQPIGQTSVVWSMAKDLPALGGNYVFTTFTEQDCCAF